jgi:OFA family oxalate/formate antiporter-like MFS transporter
MPAFTTDVFGPKNSGTIYGTMLTAWSAGAIVGPLFIAAVPYHSALPLIAGLLSVAAALAMLFPAVGRIRNCMSLRVRIYSQS